MLIPEVFNQIRIWWTIWPCHSADLVLCCPNAPIKDVLDTNQVNFACAQLAKLEVCWSLMCPESRSVQLIVYCPAGFLSLTRSSNFPLHLMFLHELSSGCQSCYPVVCVALIPLISICKQICQCLLFELNLKTLIILTQLMCIREIERYNGINTKGCFCELLGLIPHVFKDSPINECQVYFKTCRSYALAIGWELFWYQIYSGSKNTFINTTKYIEIFRTFFEEFIYMYLMQVGSNMVQNDFAWKAIYDYLFMGG